MHAGNSHAVAVAQLFDDELDKRFFRKDESGAFSREYWPNILVGEEEKLLTVCIPSYNVESYLDRCLFSLVDCRHASTLDIIVVDDGSSDRTAQIAHAYQERYPSVVRLISKKNGGHALKICISIYPTRIPHDFYHSRMIPID